MNKWVSIFVIYIGAIFYALAAYYHLHMKNWTFSKAYALALPLVLVEYIFLLYGNHAAHAYFNPMQIMIITIVFYLINIWLMNVFIFKQKITLWREAIAFAFIVAALLISTNMVLAK